MAAGTTPIFPDTINIGFGTITTADATAAKNHNGTAAGAVLLFTAGADGARVDEIRAVPLGTNTASALRIIINNGSDNTTATNNSLHSDTSLPATTISEIAGQSTVQVLKPDDNKPIYLEGGYKLYACIGTTVATGWAVTVIGADY